MIGGLVIVKPFESVAVIVCVPGVRSAMPVNVCCETSFAP